MANTHTTLAGLFSDIANAIRSKTGVSGTLVADNFPSAINGITPTKTATGTVTASGKTLTISGLGFTPTWVALFPASTSKTDTVNRVYALYYGGSAQNFMLASAASVPSGAASVSFGNGSVTITILSGNSFNFTGGSMRYVCGN